MFPASFPSSLFPAFLSISPHTQVTQKHKSEKLGLGVNFAPVFKKKKKKDNNMSSLNVTKLNVNYSRLKDCLLLLKICDAHTHKYIQFWELVVHFSKK